MYESLGHWKTFWKSWLFCKVPWTLATAGEWGSPSSWLTKDPIVLVSHQTLAKDRKNSWSSVKSWSPGRRLLVLICSSFLNFWYALYASFKPPLSTKGISQRKVTFFEGFFCLFTTTWLCKSTLSFSYFTCNIFVQGLSAIDGNWTLVTWPCHFFKSLETKLVVMLDVALLLFPYFWYVSVPHQACFV